MVKKFKTEATKNGFCTTIVSVLLRGWTMTKLLNTFRNCSSIRRSLGINYSFLNPGETITAKYYQQIDKMHQEFQRLRPTLVNRKGSILLHDNMSCNQCCWTNWTAKPCRIHRTHQNSRQPTTSSSSTSTTSCRASASTTKPYSKCFRRIRRL